jgi:hypothetical protein
MSQKLLRNRIIELGEEEDEECQFGPYGQCSIEDVENSVVQETLGQERVGQLAEASENQQGKSTESASSTNVESNTKASGGLGLNSDMQLILRMLQEGAESRIADKAEILKH